MKIIKNGELMDIEIHPAPKGVFAADEGYYYFPTFIAFSYANDNKGNIITYPLNVANENGHECLMPYTIHNTLTLKIFRNILFNTLSFIEGNRKFVIHQILNEFMEHEVYISHEVKTYVDCNKYEVDEWEL